MNRIPDRGKIDNKSSASHDELSLDRSSLPLGYDCFERQQLHPLHLSRHPSFDWNCTLVHLVLVEGKALVLVEVLDQQVRRRIVGKKREVGLVRNHDLDHSLLVVVGLDRKSHSLEEGEGHENHSLHRRIDLVVDLSCRSLEEDRHLEEGSLDSRHIVPVVHILHHHHHHHHHSRLDSRCVGEEKVDAVDQGQLVACCLVDPILQSCRELVPCLPCFDTPRHLHLVELGRHRRKRFDQLLDQCP